jgi:hypothetical protein
MASRGRVSLGALASNSDSVRSAQSAAHTASTRRSSSLSVRHPAGVSYQGLSHRRLGAGVLAGPVRVQPDRSGGGAGAARRRLRVDFRGPAHLTVLERMGVLEELRRLQTGGSPLRFVDESGVGGGCFHA